MDFSKYNRLTGFYVYLYLRHKDSKTANAGTPYYVGKGKDGRAWAKHYKITVPDNEYIQFVAQDLEEYEAFLLEKKLIALYGRKNNGTGILLNKTDGGEGLTGLVMPEAAKAIIREARKNQIFTDETRAKLSEAINNRSREVIDGIAERNRGSKRSSETKMKMSAAQKGRVSPMKGKTHSAETKLRMSEARHSFYINKRTLGV